MTNYTFNADRAIKAVWGFFENLGSKAGNVKIAGGVVADAYFRKGARDIDVFVSEEDKERYEKFCQYYRFETVTPPLRFKEEVNAYGEVRRVRIGGHTDDLIAVKKGYLLGYPVEMILVRGTAKEHILERFDQSIKSCWYDGTYYYSDAFMNTVRTGKIEPINQKVCGYVRAALSAKKYDLKTGDGYELDKHYTAYAHKVNKLEGMVSAATFEKMVKAELDFDFEIDMANVILQDVFMDHFSDKVELYKKLTTLANADIVAHHPLTAVEVKVATKDTTSYDQFRKQAIELNKLLHPYYKELRANSFTDYTEVTDHYDPKDLLVILDMHAEQFAEGKIEDFNGREVRLGKYMNKICRKYKDLFHDDAYRVLADMKKTLENRVAQSTANVYFTGTKHALTHISTNTEWRTSCQAWRGLGNNTRQNYGLLANVAGATIVAYVAEERADDDSSKWHARILVRLGEDGSVFLEQPYSARSAFYKSSDSSPGFREELAKALRAEGFTVHTTKEEAIDFRSLPMWSMPYNDCAYQISVGASESGYRFTGKGEEIRHKKKVNKLMEQVRAHYENVPVEELIEKDAEYRTFYHKLPDHLQVEDVLKLNGSFEKMRSFSDALGLEDKTNMAMHVCVRRKESDNKLYLKIETYYKYRHRRGLTLTPTVPPVATDINEDVVITSDMDDLPF